MSISHWTFCVTIPRFETRLRNRSVRKRGSPPRRSIDRMCRKNHSRIAAPTAMSTTMRPTFVLACRMPKTMKNIPSADRTAPSRSKRGFAPWMPVSATLRPSSTMPATTIACSRNEYRQLHVVVMRPPMSGPAAAPTPPIPMTTPKAFARAVTSVNSAVVRMYTGGIMSAEPTPSKIEYPSMRSGEPLCERREYRAGPVDDEPEHEASLAAPDVRELAAGDHQRGHRQQEHA